MIARADFMASVRQCIGTPVVHMGRTIGKAIDCVGLPWAACNALGMCLPATANYDALPSEHDLSDGLAAYCDEVADGGHLWQVFVGSQARHIVIPSGVNQCGQQLVIHAWGNGRRVVVETVFSRTVAKRWNIRGIE
jgi:hypothetical protein